MDSQFIPKAIDMVKDAIAADNNQDYEVALGLYKKSLEYFMTGLKYENNPVSLSFSGMPERSSRVFKFLLSALFPSSLLPAVFPNVTPRLHLTPASVVQTAEGAKVMTRLFPAGSVFIIAH